jgi:hypothetical protein
MTRLKVKLYPEENILKDSPFITEKAFRKAWYKL